MKVIISGTTGMVGQGVLRECMLDDESSSLLTVGRTATGIASPKLVEIRHPDLLDYGGSRVVWRASMHAFSASSYHPQG